MINRAIIFIVFAIVMVLLFAMMCGAAYAFWITMNEGVYALTLIAALAVIACAGIMQIIWQAR